MWRSAGGQVPCENQCSQKTLLVGVVWYRIQTVRCSVDPLSDMNRGPEAPVAGSDPLSAWYDTQTSILQARWQQGGRLWSVYGWFQAGTGVQGRTVVSGDVGGGTKTCDPAGDKVCATVGAMMSGSGMASSQRVNLFTQVRR